MRIKWLWPLCLAVLPACILHAAEPAAAESSPAAAQASAVPTAPSFADLARRAAVDSMQISPNGKLLAATVPVDAARRRIGVIDLDTMQVKSSIQLRSADETFSSFMWVNNTYLLLTIARRPGGLAEAQVTGELATLNAETGRLSYAFGYRGEMKTGSRIDKVGGELAAAFPIGPVPGTDTAMVEVMRYDATEHSGVRVLDVSTGRNKRVTQSPVRRGRFLLDHTGAVRLAYGGATIEEHRVHAREADGKWRLLESRGQSGRQLFPLHFAADNTHFYAQSTRKGAPDAIVRVNITDGSETPVYASEIADPDGLVLSFDHKDVVAVRTHEGKPGLHWLQPRGPEARLVRTMEAQMPGHVVYPVSSSEDGQRVLLLALSDRNAGDYYLFDRQTKRADLIMSERKWLPIEALAPVEPIAFKARDGLQLHGYLTMPYPAIDHPPLVVMPHGGPHGVRDRWEFDASVQALATRGFAVLQVNFRGSGGYGVDFEVSGHREWGGKMQEDLTDATRWAIESGKVNAEKIAVYGSSYGGYAALMGAAQEPDLYRCAISYVGVTDLPLMFTRGDIEDTRYGMSYLREVLGSDTATLEANSPSRLAKRIKAKVFLIHGARDDRVPLKHADLMRDALTEAGNPPEWFVEADEGHGFAKDSANEQLHTRVDGFLRKCLDLK